MPSASSTINDQLQRLSLSWNVGNVSALAGAAIITIGAFLPWAIVAFVAVTGTEAGVGWGFILGAVGVAVTASFSVRGLVGAGIGVCLIALGIGLSVGLAAEFTNVSSLAQQANVSGFNLATPGAGLDVMAVGVALVLFGGIYELIRNWTER